MIAAGVRAVVAQALALLRSAGLDAQAAPLDRAIRAAIAPGSAGRPAAPRTPGDRVATRHLPPALTAARAGTTVVMARAVESLMAELRWTQTAGYVAAPPHPGFLGRYAHTALLGPASAQPLLLDPSSAVLLGLLLLGASNDYPLHRHPADEVYLPLTAAEWRSGDAAPYRTVAAGSVLHHGPGFPHAVRTPDGPLLAVYLWTGDLATSASFC